MEREKVWHKIPDPSLRSKKSFPVHSLRRVVLGEYTLCLARTEEGLIAFDERCPHAGHPLSTGWCNEKTLTCPLHDIKFDLKTGRSLFQEGYRLRLHPVVENENGIFIQL